MNSAGWFLVSMIAILYFVVRHDIKKESKNVG